MGQTDKEAAAKAALSAKCRAEADAALQAKIDQARRDVPPGIEVTETVEVVVPTPASACAAFVEAQSEFEPIPFDKENPHFKAKYASLSAVLKATLPALNRHGIALTSRTKIEGDRIIVKTCLVFRGLPFVCATWPVGAVGTSPQQLGSALTYARRYSIQSVLGVAAEDDDDGNAASASKGAAPAADPF